MKGNCSESISRRLDRRVNAGMNDSPGPLSLSLNGTSQTAENIARILANWCYSSKRDGQGYAKSANRLGARLSSTFRGTTFTTKVSLRQSRRSINSSAVAPLRIFTTSCSESCDLCIPSSEAIPWISKGIGKTFAACGRPCSSGSSADCEKVLAGSLASHQR